MKQKRLMVMAGGTGGHVFPGLAVAHELMNEGWNVRWLGTSDRMEAQLVPKHGIDIDFITISGLRGKGLFALLGAPFRIIRAIFQARKIMNAYKPDAVLGMGGYVSGPGGIAAWSLGIPVVLHEQNGIAGLTNQWLAKIAKRVLQAFPGAFKDAQVVGNPVRLGVLMIPDPQERLTEHEGALRILVIGGSQGARILNQTLPQALAKLPYPFTVWHQAGKGAKVSTEADYTQSGVQDYRVTEFIDDMAEAYSWADLIVCRSGALTVSEVAAAGLPAIFIPFMHKDRQQYWNAQPLEKAGAAIIIEQPDLSIDRLVDKLTQLDRKKLLEMAIKARKSSIPDATQRVASVIKAVAK